MGCGPRDRCRGLSRRPAPYGSLCVDEPAGRIETREPGYFILGSKSFGRESSFFLRDGFEQVRKVFALLAGNPRLDLYAKKAA